MTAMMDGLCDMKIDTVYYIHPILKLQRASFGASFYPSLQPGGSCCISIHHELTVHNAGQPCFWKVIFTSFPTTRFIQPYSHSSPLIISPAGKGLTRCPRAPLSRAIALSPVQWLR